MPITSNFSQSRTGPAAGAGTGGVRLQGVMFSYHFSSLIRGAGRAWGLACALMMFLFFLAATAHAVPPGTIIDNTARATFRVGGMQTFRDSGTVTIVTEWPRTPAQIELLQYAPFLTGAPMVPVAPTAYDPDGIAGGATQQIAAVYPAGDMNGTPIDLSQPVPLVNASLYHQGEPCFVRVEDRDQNIDPLTAETIWVQFTIAATGDTELLILTESDPDSGIFCGYIQSSGLGPIAAYNGVLDVTEDARIDVRYTDIVDATDTVVSAVLVDPLGLVFDSATGLPVDGAQLTLIDENTGQPATIFGDDGRSDFPATIESGGTVVDDSGKVYAFAPGRYRFPFVAPGNYRIAVAPPAGYAAPSTVSTALLQSLPGAPYVIVPQASFGQAFDINPGPAVRIDIPIDPSATGLWLQKTVNQDTAAIGDFVQYAVTVENTSGDPAAGTVITDLLPRGLRYRPGSARLDGQSMADPQIASDGRNLTFGLGDIADGDTRELRYVVEIAAGAKTGKAVNRAQASAAGNLTSNLATAALTIEEDLFRSRNFIAGRVIADNCDDQPADENDGVPGVRLYLEDGTYVVTDDQGMYHFEGVTSGTHIVQLDLDTIPEPYEISACGENTRQAGTPFSRFVDLHGGTLWREDFFVQTKAAPTGETELKLACRLDRRQVHFKTEISVRDLPIGNARLSVMMPESCTYVDGSSRLGDGTAVMPRQMGKALVYRLGDAPAGKKRVVTFSLQLNDEVAPGNLHTKAMLTFNAPGRRNQRSPIIDTVLALDQRKEREVQPPMVIRPTFGILSTDLTPEDRDMLDLLVKKLADLEIEHVVLTGHTDNRLIRADSRHQYPDNHALSLARAENVARYLEPRLNLHKGQVTISGKGADQPMADNATEAGRALNRRVAVKVMSVKVRLIHDIATIKCEDSTVMATAGARAKKPTVAETTMDETPPAQPKFEAIALQPLEPGLAWVMPADDFQPHIPSVKLAVQHGPREQIELLLNDRPVNPLNFDGRKKNKAGSVVLSLWRGVDLEDGDNRFVAICRDHQGRESGRIAKTVHFAGPPVQAQYLPGQSQLKANGRDVPVIAVRLTDAAGFATRFGITGEYTVQSPFQAYTAKERVDNDPVVHTTSDKILYRVGHDGIARIRLQPTTRSGQAVIEIPLADKTHEIRVWMQPAARDWILVGLAEGTLGYNTVSGNMENLDSADQEEDFYRDGRVAFFAKGKIKGDWLLTAAYDSAKEKGEVGNNLFQTIDPDTYYTLYGDASRQQYEASSIRKLYLKIERDRFYALFGDYDTGLTVTELSRYSRRFNGIKSEFQSERFSYSAFATDTDQAFVKDEIRGDGTSGLYRLSRRNILINSEEVTIETRDRFRSEVIIASQTLSRHVDYNIDYDAGTLFFKQPVYSRDENFNPNYIVVDYESGDAGNEAYTYGGRGAIKLAGGKVEVGASHIHEGPENAEADLSGVDATVDLGHGMRLTAEVATSNKQEAGEEISGNGYLAELTKKSGNLDATLYYREQEDGFGLGQQNGGEAATRKVGADAAWKIEKQWTLSGEAYRSDNLATDARRNLGEARVDYRQPDYGLYTGLRLVEDQLGDGDSNGSTQLLLGGSRYFLDKRLLTRITHEQSLGSGDESVDYPTRTIMGADYRLTQDVSVFAEHEITQGNVADTQSSRAGLKASPWQGGEIGSSVGRQYNADGQRIYANMGLLQKWEINQRWSVDGGLDRSQTVQKDQNSAPLNTNVPTAAGAEEDFTAVTLGAGYRAERWSWTGRLESRMAESEDKWSIITGIAGEVRKGLGLSAGLKLFSTENDTGIDTLEGDVRLSLAYRPLHSAWIVFNRLDYKLEDRRDAGGKYEARRIVNNLNTNYKPHHRMQIALQYGAKYVFDTIDEASYTGYTDLAGLEARYDLTKRWDLGVHASILHSWDAGQIDYRTGASVGHNLAKNMWVSLGYNLNGFTDEDFSGAEYTAAGPYLKFRMKFDQQSVKEMVNWFGAK